MANYAATGGPVLKADMGQFHRIFQKTSPIDKVLRTELRKNIRVAAKSIAKQVQAEVLKPPVNDSPNTASSGLRKDIAAGIKIRIATGNKASVSIQSTGRLAKQYDGARVRPWRHPVFGDRQTWVTQTGRPYFDSVISPRKDEVTKAVIAAMQKAVDSLK